MIVIKMRAPDGLVHIWFDHDPGFLDSETVCEYIDDLIHWPRETLKETSDAPTCIRCVARWT